MPKSRELLCRHFLSATPWAAAERQPLSGDASFRRYERLVGGPSPAMLMDAPPPTEDVRPFVRIARHLGGLGLSAPSILAEDAENGFLVLEDFGDATYTRCLAAGEDERRLYELATDTLIALHRHANATAVDAAPYDAPRLWQEASLLTEWYLPALGLAADGAVTDGYREVWSRLFPLAATTPVSLVLRDYHVDNLMQLPDREGVAQCGLLDFQDAVIGSTAYDLVSLVGDARRDIAPELRADMIDRYLTAFPKVDRDAFGAALAMLSAQRNCKIIGIFTRLLIRDGKPVYLKHIPRVWRLLESDIQHPALAPLATWLDTHVPKDARRVPAAADSEEAHAHAP